MPELKTPFPTLEQISRMPVDQVAFFVHKTAKEHGWWDDESGLPTERNFGEMLALMHSELSEALEAWRDNQPGSCIVGDKPEGWAIELADCVIRIFDTLYQAGHNPGVLIGQKMLYNETRPYRHGGKRA